MPRLRAYNTEQENWDEAKLPVAAVTAAAASATAAATATAVTSAPATTAAAVTPTAATTTACAFTLRTRFVDDERAAEKFLPVQSCDHLFGFRIVPNFGESEAARLAREPIAKQRERIRLHARLPQTMPATSSSVALNERLPTYSFFTVLLLVPPPVCGWHVLRG